jgi:cytochrome P450
MVVMANLVLSGLAFAFGVASHVVYFHQGEHHFHAVRYLNAFLLSLVGGVIGLYKGVGFPFGTALGATLSVVFSTIAGIFASLLVYRLFLNPLNRFPGPFAARVSSLSWSARLTGLDAYKQLKDLHDKHGKYVRIGSHDLSIVEPDGMQITYGPQAKAVKGTWYDGDHPRVSMQTTRSRAFHDKRRRVWAPAFSDKALREYETNVETFNATVVSKFKEFHGAPVNVTKWFMLYSFDVMGRLAFGKNYGMLESGVQHDALHLMTEGMAPLGIMPPTWLFKLLVSIPGLSAGYQKFVKFCNDEMAWRVKNDGRKGGGGGDIMGWILKAYKDVANPENDHYLQADSRLIIVAGSDTTSATLTYLWFHLAQQPEHQQRIREELKSVTQGEWSDKDLNSLPHLNGAINEALRLHPPVPSGVQRMTPKEGMMVGDTFIPGNTNFWMPQYVMGRDERIYSNADSFVPERWYSKPGMIKHKDAFAPFSMGKSKIRPHSRSHRR